MLVGTLIASTVAHLGTAILLLSVLVHYACSQLYCSYITQTTGRILSKMV